MGSLFGLVAVSKPAGTVLGCVRVLSPGTVASLFGLPGGAKTSTENVILESMSVSVLLVASAIARINACTEYDAMGLGATVT